MNKLNAIRHQRKNKQKKLEQLQKQVEQMSKETDEIQKTDIGESPDAQVPTTGSVTSICCSTVNDQSS